MQEAQQKKRFTINALSSAGQALISGATMFFLYKYLLSVLPTDDLGVWSLILSTASLSRIAELGVSSGVVKFVSMWLARNNRKEAVDVIRTALTISGGAIAVVLICAWFISDLILPIILNTAYITLAKSIIIPALFSFWLSVIGSIFQSGLDGCNRMDKRSILNIVSSLLYFGASYFLTEHWGLLGLAYAQIIQAIFVVGATYSILYKELPEISFMPFGYTSRHAKDLLSYGLNMQVAMASITFLAEPLTKTFLSSVGGLASVTYFDMANKIIIQVRSVILSAYNALVPIISAWQETKQESIDDLYSRTLTIMSFITFTIFALVIGFSPLLSLVWIGSIKLEFLRATWLIAIGYAFNTALAAPYFINLGKGTLRQNLVVHLVNGGTNIICGYLLGMYFGEFGVLVAWMLSLLLSAFVGVYLYHRSESLPYSNIFTLGYIGMVVANSIGALLVAGSQFLFESIIYKSISVVLGSSIIFFTIIFLSRYSPHTAFFVPAITKHLYKFRR